MVWLGGTCPGLCCMPCVEATYHIFPPKCKIRVGPVCDSPKDWGLSSWLPPLIDSCTHLSVRLKSCPSCKSLTPWRPFHSHALIFCDPSTSIDVWGFFCLSCHAWNCLAPFHVQSLSAVKDCVLHEAQIAYQYWWFCCLVGRLSLVK